MLIAFEGIDGSGKSFTAKALAEDIDFLYTKEPTFTSEEADALNLGSKNDIQREIEFAVDRIRHTNDVLRKYENVICDRYIWTGLAYCSIYNPVAFPFAEALYNHNFFVKPDIYIFVDTPVEICFERKKVQPLEHLQKLREAYYKTLPLIQADSKLMYISGVGPVEDSVLKIKKELGKFLKDKIKISKRETVYECGCRKETFGFEHIEPPPLCETHGMPITGESNMVDEI
jgi:thymidylate kinase